MSPHLALLRLVVPLPARRVDWELDVDLLLRGVGKALLILAVAWVARWALHRLSRRIIQHAQTGDPATAGARAQRAATLAQLLNHTGMVVITIVALLLALDIFINIGPLLAGAGVLGVAASLGGQAMMKDLFSGFVIVLEDQYAVGDRVRIDSVEGTVQLLTLRSTVVRSDDGALHFVANGSVAAVANLSRRNAGHVS